ncbi:MULTISPECIES: hypothetical protein [unclassified Streptomyces]|uniref:hypothetical protein n=1 Tax=unclassified Streptomyces TaxID=2593676 RepID=UPI0035E12F51
MEGITIGRLAEELERSKSGVHEHFGTKESLQISTLDKAFVREMRVRRLGWAGREIETGGERLVIDYVRDLSPLFPGWKPGRGAGGAERRGRRRAGDPPAPAPTPPPPRSRTGCRRGRRCCDRRPVMATTWRT